MTRKLFIDCGGHDGCSIIKFLEIHPDFECFSFEPNPILWPYYRLLPTTLYQSAALTYDGTVMFFIDPVDADGSTVIERKRVDATGSLLNEQCPAISVPCIDLDSFISNNTSPDDYLVLKLDVEGAEYEILEKMIRTGSINRVRELFIEFHWERAGIPAERHITLIETLKAKFGCEPQIWDASSFSVHRLGPTPHLRRFIMLLRIHFRRLLRKQYRLVISTL